MKYENMKEGRFLDRPNRFIAHVEIWNLACKVGLDTIEIVSCKRG